VAENRPFNAYVQGSNTGTEETTEWRERFGLSHNQLTGRDDVLQLDYITGGFSEVHAVFGSYEAPIWSWDWLRGRVGGAYSQYDASELAILESRFEGEQWDVSTQFVANVWQWGDLFVDLFAGARFQRVRTDNQPIVDFPEADVTGKSDFFLPELGLRVERVTRESTLRAAVSGEWNVAAIAGTKSSDLADMGRSFVDEENFELMRWDLFASFFLEPLVNPAAYDDPATPCSSTLAHEIALSSRGQWAFDNRLIPAHERIAGGLYTVRGYEQSAVAGDSAALGRAEYRFHLPRALGIRPVPTRLPLIGDFRVTPQQVYGLPDWDLILRGFVDAGRVWVSDRQPGEDHETLVGAGLGVELRILSNLVVSFDWGRALREARGGELEKGNNEYHFVATLIY
jgi:hemolysin activation/secretion protein